MLQIPVRMSDDTDIPEIQDQEKHGHGLRYSSHGKGFRIPLPGKCEMEFL